MIDSNLYWKISMGDKIRELFCKDYGIDFLKAAYNLGCHGTKYRKLMEEYINNNIDLLLESTPKM